MSMWQSISMAGSMGVLGPAGLALAVWLAGAGAWRQAYWWCALFAGGMALVVLSKIVFIGWGVGWPSVGFAGFSGHAMRAGAVLPVACFLICRNASAPVRQAGVLAGVACAALVGMSRVIVHAHTPSEALGGFWLGVALALAFIWYAKSAQRMVLNPVLVTLTMCLLALTPKAQPIPTERIVTRVALYLSGHERPFTRHDWIVAERRKSLP